MHCLCLKNRAKNADKKNKIKKKTETQRYPNGFIVSWSALETWIDLNGGIKASKSPFLMAAQSSNQDTNANHLVLIFKASYQPHSLIPTFFVQYPHHAKERKKKKKGKYPESIKGSSEHDMT